MNPHQALSMFKRTALVGVMLGMMASAQAAEKELLEVLLQNGVITQEQYDNLITKETLTSSDILQKSDAEPEKNEAQAIAVTDERIDAAVADEVARKIDEEFPVKASYGSSGFRLETRDGNFQTNLQWRAQFRFSNPYLDDPRQLSDFDSQEDKTNFEPRRLRMKIGGHGFQPWVKYYFEVDLQPNRDPDSSSANSSARVIDWRVDLAKWDWGTLRLGQWKIDHNRERVDSSGRQQFVERSIATRTFTIDRQVGVQLRGHLFKNTAADMRYFAGVFNGEGRGVSNNDEGLMYAGRLQWNFLGRDLDWRQTDVEYTENPTGSLAFGAVTNTGSCTRWSSSGCGNLDGFDSPAVAETDQFKVEQTVQEFAYKWRGFSVQQEYHRKTVTDRVNTTKNDLKGGYMQTGYFFHNLIPAIPAPLELAVRYAFVEEPNETDLDFDNERKEYTLGANWFFSGHNNKLTMDYSHLTMDDGLVGLDESDNRIRLQWDVSF